MATDSHSDDLDPDAVGRREFTRSRRGFDQIEVRAFLNAVAAQLRSERQRQVELTRKLADAESRAARSRASDAQRLTTVLGEETARIIEVAREAAQEMRDRAETETTQVREEAARGLAEAQQTAEDSIEQARGDAVATRDQATTEAMAEVEQAKDRAREMVNEARAHRERVMHDVARRRKALRAQYQTLAGVRDQMLERLDASQGLLGGAIDEVRRALHDDVALVHPTDDADVIDHDEEHEDPDAISLEDERVFHRVRTPAPPIAEMIDEEDPSGEADELEAADLEEPVIDDAAEDELVVDGATAVAEQPVAEETEEEMEAVVVLDEAPADESAAEERVSEVVDEAVDEDPTADEAAEDAEPAGDLDAQPEDVDLLFAKLRAESSDEVSESPDEPDAAPAPTDLESDEALDLREDAASSQSTDDESDVQALLDPGTDPFGARDQILAPVDRTLQRQLKRVLADDQNGVLDRLRTARGKPTPERILADLDDLAYAAAEASTDSLVEAYRAGASHVDGPEGDAAAAASQLHPVYESGIAEPLRTAVAAILDASDDIEELSEQVRAAYRTFRTEQLSDVSAHLVAAAYARGRYDAIDPEVDVVWLQDPAASSPDCEDNELAGVVTKGTMFPTGAECAPAYEGCRCLVIPAALAPTPSEA